ncbi:hypothetical protein VKT23_012312 [Stygiomarasmius scandens]|uniref:Uncharacterized protein n=1 Tax=Marasmiellus scandens TaxID=2682957 RepID=A0ABR1JBL0_9AGAR
MPRDRLEPSPLGLLRRQPPLGISFEGIIPSRRLLRSLFLELRLGPGGVCGGAGTAGAGGGEGGGDI